MQRRLARTFFAWCLGTMLLAALCVSYMYSDPSPVGIVSLEQVVEPTLPVASQPSRMAFISYSADSTIRAFWKSPEESKYRFTIEIDPVDDEVAAEDEAQAAADADADTGNEDSTATDPADNRGE